MSKVIHQTRLNQHGEFDKHGRLFVCPKTAAITDLSNVELLRLGVDTVRQMYRGTIAAGVLELVEQGGFVDFGGYTWAASRVGRDSGYQYKLQNSDLGLILLIKNFNCRDDVPGPHLKIEVSPHFIEYHTPANLQAKIDALAALVLDDCTPNQCAVHLALDVTGWQPPADTVHRMQCRSRKVRDISGVDTIDWAANASVYGNCETFMFGSAAGLQLSIYNKTKQARATDRLDYWETIWRKTYKDLDTPAYNGETVWRVELRFHHSVVQQFASGSANKETGELIDTRTFAELAPHLRGLWRYGFEAFKLLETPATYSPAWTLFCFDPAVQSGAECLSQEHHYRRHYKTAGGFSGKNIELFLGNFVSIVARERLGAGKAFEELKKFSGFQVIADHFESKGKSERDIYRWLRDKLQERHIRYGVAV